jgi:DNA-directed RNA polymerase I, II, and III subunit RPABC2
MADSEDSKNDLKEIFMSSTIRTGNKTKTIPNTAQNIYINQVSKSKVSNNLVGGKTKINKQLSKNDTEIEESDDNTGSGSGSDSESELNSDSESIAGSEEEVDPNDEPEDEYEKKDDDEEIVSDIEEDGDDADDEENDEVADTDYNEDGTNEKDTEMNNDEEDDDDCLYQYDDLVEERDSERQAYEIPLAERMTDPQITHYEKVRILGVRAKQIAMGSKVMVKYDNSMGPVELAKYELQHKTTPLVIKRPLPDNSFEIWKVSELNIDDDDSHIIKQDLEKSFTAVANKNNLYAINMV